MNIYRVRYWPMSDGQAKEVEVPAEDLIQARKIVQDDFDKYLCAQIMSVVFVREEETQA